jgi:hypothetical protein
MLVGECAVGDQEDAVPACAVARRGRGHLADKRLAGAGRGDDEQVRFAIEHAGFDRFRLDLGQLVDLLDPDLGHRWGRAEADEL